jgi:hypothetical protein
MGALERLHSEISIQNLLKTFHGFSEILMCALECHHLIITL